jgi:magnesium chelatase family protein
MITKVFSATAVGLQASLVECEINISNGLPAVVIVGLPDKAVQESKERIRSAITQSGFEFPMAKITINLAPAGISKTGSGLDLPIAIGILKIAGFITKEVSNQSLFLGELSLDGSLRPVNGVLSICLWAKNNGFKEVFVPKENYREASLVKEIKVFAIENLESLVKHLNFLEVLEPVKSINLSQVYEDVEKFEDILFSNKKAQLDKDYNSDGVLLQPNDLAYIRGQAIAKRALEIASCGGHNLLFIGEPGSGKTLLARSYSTILPLMTEEEVLEVTQIYSSAGLLPNGKISLERPFRSPHHSASHISLVGGGTKLKPGEVSLAHRGVLFLDEFPEFSLESIEALRQPLEDGFVTITRASGSVTYPARFHLVAAANPSPSGYNDGNSIYQSSSAGKTNKYKSKFSGPILDRIDLQVEVNKPEKSELENETLSEPSELVLRRVQTGRDIQNHRFKGQKISTNAEMTLPMIKKYCQLDSKTKELLSLAIDRFNLSARGYMRLLKVSRTIADLDFSESIQHHHLAESLQYRGKW